MDEWIEAFSEKHKRKYWKNKSTGETTWKEPAKSDKSSDDQESKTTPSLASSANDEWEELYNDKHKRKYWKNKTTGESTWKDPRKPGNDSSAKPSQPPPPQPPPPPTSVSSTNINMPLPNVSATSSPTPPAPPPPPPSLASKTASSTLDSDSKPSDAGMTDWEELFNDKHKRKYWKNKKTGETSWKKPENTVVVDSKPITSSETDEKKAANTSEWEELFSEKHKRKYWKNKKTGETSWKEPEELAKSSASADTKTSSNNNSTSESPIPDSNTKPTISMKDDTWEELFSDKHKRKYWKHKKTGETSWKKPVDAENVDPLPVSVPVSVVGNPTLESTAPKVVINPWKELFNEKHQRKYWKHIETGEIVWKQPDIVVNKSSSEDRNVTPSPLGSKEEEESSGENSMKGSSLDWEELFHDKHKRKYWKNKKTGEISWKEPIATMDQDDLDSKNVEKKENTRDADVRSPTKNLLNEKEEPKAMNSSSVQSSEDSVCEGLLLVQGRPVHAVFTSTLLLKVNYLAESKTMNCSEGSQSLQFDIQKCHEIVLNEIPGHFYLRFRWNEELASGIQDKSNTNQISTSVADLEALSSLDSWNWVHLILLQVSRSSTPFRINLIDKTEESMTSISKLALQSQALAKLMTLSADQIEWIRHFECQRVTNISQIHSLLTPFITPKQWEEYEAFLKSFSSRSSCSPMSGISNTGSSTLVSPHQNMEGFRLASSAVLPISLQVMENGGDDDSQTMLIHRASTSSPWNGKHISPSGTSNEYFSYYSTGAGEYRETDISMEHSNNSLPFYPAYLKIDLHRQALAVHFQGQYSPANLVWSLRHCVVSSRSGFESCGRDSQDYKQTSPINYNPLENEDIFVITIVYEGEDNDDNSMNRSVSVASVKSNTIAAVTMNDSVGISMENERMMDDKERNKQQKERSPCRKLTILFHSTPDFLSWITTLKMLSSSKSPLTAFLHGLQQGLSIVAQRNISRLRCQRLDIRPSIKMNRLRIINDRLVVMNSTSSSLIASSTSNHVNTRSWNQFIWDDDVDECVSTRDNLAPKNPDDDGNYLNRSHTTDKISDNMIAAVETIYVPDSGDIHARRSDDRESLTAGSLGYFSESHVEDHQISTLPDGGILWGFQGLSIFTLSSSSLLQAWQDLPNGLDQPIRDCLIWQPLKAVRRVNMRMKNHKPFQGELVIAPAEIQLHFCMPDKLVDSGDDGSTSFVVDSLNEKPNPSSALPLKVSISATKFRLQLQWLEPRKETSMIWKSDDEVWKSLRDANVPLGIEISNEQHSFLLWHDDFQQFCHLVENLMECHKFYAMPLDDVKDLLCSFQNMRIQRNERRGSEKKSSKVNPSTTTPSESKSDESSSIGKDGQAEESLREQLLHACERFEMSIRSLGLPGGCTFPDLYQIGTVLNRLRQSQERNLVSLGKLSLTHSGVLEKVFDDFATLPGSIDQLLAIPVGYNQAADSRLQSNKGSSGLSAPNGGYGMPSTTSLLSNVNTGKSNSAHLEQSAFSSIANGKNGEEIYSTPSVSSSSSAPSSIATSNSLASTITSSTSSSILPNSAATVEMVTGASTAISSSNSSTVSSTASNSSHNNPPMTSPSLGSRRSSIRKSLLLDVMPTKAPEIHLNLSRDSSISLVSKDGPSASGNDIPTTLTSPSSLSSSSSSSITTPTTSSTVSNTTNSLPTAPSSGNVGSNSGLASSSTSGNIHAGMDSSMNGSNLAGQDFNGKGYGNGNGTLSDDGKSHSGYQGMNSGASFTLVDSNTDLLSPDLYVAGVGSGNHVDRGDGKPRMLNNASSSTALLVPSGFFTLRGHEPHLLHQLLGYITSHPRTLLQLCGALSMDEQESLLGVIVHRTLPCWSCQPKQLYELIKCFSQFGQDNSLASINSLSALRRDQSSNDSRKEMSWNSVRRNTVNSNNMYFYGPPSSTNSSLPVSSTLTTPPTYSTSSLSSSIPNEDKNSNNRNDVGISLSHMLAGSGSPLTSLVQVWCERFEIQKFFQTLVENQLADLFASDAVLNWMNHQNNPGRETTGQTSNSLWLQEFLEPFTLRLEKAIVARDCPYSLVILIGCLRKYVGGEKLHGKLSQDIILKGVLKHLMTGLRVLQTWGNLKIDTLSSMIHQIRQAKKRMVNFQLDGKRLSTQEDNEDIDDLDSNDRDSAQDQSSRKPFSKKVAKSSSVSTGNKNSDTMSVSNKWGSLSSGFSSPTRSSQTQSSHSTPSSDDEVVIVVEDEEGVDSDQHMDESRERDDENHEENQTTSFIPFSRVPFSNVDESSAGEKSSSSAPVSVRSTSEISSTTSSQSARPQNSHDSHSHSSIAGGKPPISTLKSQQHRRYSHSDADNLNSAKKLLSNLNPSGNNNRGNGGAASNSLKSTVSSNLKKTASKLPSNTSSVKESAGPSRSKSSSLNNDTKGNQSASVMNANSRKPSSTKTSTSRLTSKSEDYSNVNGSNGNGNGQSNGKGNGSNNNISSGPRGSLRDTLEHGLNNNSNNFVLNSLASMESSEEDSLMSSEISDYSLFDTQSAKGNSKSSYRDPAIKFQLELDHFSVFFRNLLSFYQRGIELWNHVFGKIPTSVTAASSSSSTVAVNPSTLASSGSAVSSSSSTTTAATATTTSISSPALLTNSINSVSSSFLSLHETASISRVTLQCQRFLDVCDEVFASMKIWAYLDREINSNSSNLSRQTPVFGEYRTSSSSSSSTTSSSLSSSLSTPASVASSTTSSSLSMACEFPGYDFWPALVSKSFPILMHGDDLQIILRLIADNPACWSSFATTSTSNSMSSGYSNGRLQASVSSSNSSWNIWKTLQDLHNLSSSLKARLEDELKSTADDLVVLVATRDTISLPLASLLALSSSSSSTTSTCSAAVGVSSSLDDEDLCNPLDEGRMIEIDGAPGSSDLKVFSWLLQASDATLRNIYECEFSNGFDPSLALKMNSSTTATMNLFGKKVSTVGFLKESLKEVSSLQAMLDSKALKIQACLEDLKRLDASTHLLGLHQNILQLLWNQRRQQLIQIKSTMPKASSTSTSTSKPAWNQSKKNVASSSFANLWSSVLMTLEDENKAIDRPSYSYQSSSASKSHISSTSMGSYRHLYSSMNDSPMIATSWLLSIWRLENNFLEKEGRKSILVQGEDDISWLESIMEDDDNNSASDDGDDSIEMIKKGPSKTDRSDRSRKSSSSSSQGDLKNEPNNWKLRNQNGGSKSTSPRVSSLHGESGSNSKAVHTTNKKNDVKSIHFDKKSPQCLRASWGGSHDSFLQDMEFQMSSQSLNALFLQSIHLEWDLLFQMYVNDDFTDPLSSSSLIPSAPASSSSSSSSSAAAATTSSVNALGIVYGSPSTKISTLTSLDSTGMRQCGNKDSDASHSTPYTNSVLSGLEDHVSPSSTMSKEVSDCVTAMPTSPLVAYDAQTELPSSLPIPSTKGNSPNQPVFATPKMPSKASSPLNSTKISSPNQTSLLSATTASSSTVTATAAVGSPLIRNSSRLMISPSSKSLSLMKNQSLDVKSNNYGGMPVCGMSQEAGIGDFSSKKSINPLQMVIRNVFPTSQ